MWALIALVGLLVLVAGIVGVIRPMPRLHMATRASAAAAVLVGLLLLTLGAVQDRTARDAADAGVGTVPAAHAPVAPAPVPIGSDDPGGVLTRDEYAGEWPFTVERGELRCLPPGRNVVFVAEGVTYALDDTARASNQWPDFQQHIWRDHPRIPGAKIPVGADLIGRGLALCER